jgi:hypothetical protein
MLYIKMAVSSSEIKPSLKFIHNLHYYPNINVL